MVCFVLTSKMTMLGHQKGHSAYLWPLLELGQSLESLDSSLGFSDNMIIFGVDGIKNMNEHHVGAGK